jgi:hypothetical protein
MSSNRDSGRGMAQWFASGVRAWLLWITGQAAAIVYPPA